MTKERVHVVAEKIVRSLVHPDGGLAILEVNEAAAIETLDDAAALIRALLSSLREWDPSETRPLTDGIDDPAWDFRFAGHAYFVSLFAPLYPPDHPRWSGEEDVAFVLFQPERSFRGFGISSERPNRPGLSGAVQRRFARHGQPYDLTTTTELPKAMRYVKPLHTGDPPVRWWVPDAPPR